MVFCDAHDKFISFDCGIHHDGELDRLVSTMISGKDMDWTGVQHDIPNVVLEICSTTNLSIVHTALLSHQCATTLVIQ
jgi:hypothetical protein